MKAKPYSMDHWHIIPSIVYYNDFDWCGSRNIDFVWLKWGISIMWEQKRGDI